jgi:hypothetical protein
MHRAFHLAAAPAAAAVTLAAIALVFPALASALGSPRLVAGSSYFNPAVMGQPIRWPSGQINYYYYVDQGPLSVTISNQHAIEHAVAMVDSAAALWSAVPTAAVSLIDNGALQEDVGGAVAGNGLLLQPADVAASATGHPIAVLFDYDGSIIDAVLVLNGRCTDTSNQLEMMSFLLARAFGLVLGLGPSQFYPDALTTMRSDEAQAWPVVQPESGACGPSGGRRIPNIGTLQPDDVAQLNRLFPVTPDNQSAFPGELLTAASTVSITGKLTFRTGTGMQGVNVLAVPLDANGNPLVQYIHRDCGHRSPLQRQSREPRAFGTANRRLARSSIQPAAATDRP